MSGGTDGLVRLWDVSDPRQIRSLGAAPGKGKSVEDAAFSLRGGLLASADRDGKVRLWKVPADLSRAGALGAPYVFDGAQGAAVYSVAFAPDGKVLASGGGNQSTLLWNVADPAEPTRMGKPLPQTNSILALAFSADGRVVAAGDGDGDVVLWDVARRRAMGSSLPGAHSGSAGQAAIDTVQFDPAGGALYSAGRGQAITAWSPALWSQDPETLVKNACRLARRNLTAEEWSVLFAGTKLAGHRHRTCPEYPLP
jgi:WD40 repeat protein